MPMDDPSGSTSTDILPLSKEKSFRESILTASMSSMTVDPSNTAEATDTVLLTTRGVSVSRESTA